MNGLPGRMAWRRLFLGFLAATLAFGAAGAAVGTPGRAEAAPVNLAANPGFEDSGSDWSGWTYDGTRKDGMTPAVFIHTKPGTGDVHSGERSLGYWLDEDFSFTLTQTLDGLEDGEYALRAWAQGGESGLAGTTSLKLFAVSGGVRTETAMAVTAWGDWRQYTVAPVQVTGGQVTIGFDVSAPAGQWGAFDDVEFVRLAAEEPAPAWGADKSLETGEVTPYSVKLTWSGVSDPAGAASYRIYQNGQLRTTVPGSVYSYHIMNLTPGTEYRFKVEAGNASGQWSMDGPEATVTTPDGPPADRAFIKGADISTLPAIEDAGGKYYDNGVERDLLAILKERGVNWIRLRLWNDPVLADGYNDLAHTMAMAKRVKQAGLKWLLDFHYSDFWADPGKQEKPAAWRDLTFDELKEAVYAYTADVLNELKAAGAYPDMVQIGNEINNGMLHPDGAASDFDKLAELLGSGIRAVRDTTPPGHDTRVMIHLAEGGDNAKFRSFFDALTARNNDFDVIGLSFYPYWHGTYQQLKDNLNDLATRYGKELVVVETAHPHTLADGDGWPNLAGAAEAEKAGFPATPEGQAAVLTLVMNTVAHTVNGKGTGVFYWEPAWIPVPKDENGNFQAGWKTKEGNAWDNQAMFDFAGRALPSLDAFRFDAANPPAKAPVRVMNPEGVTVPANEPADQAAARLPATVSVLFNEGSIEQVPVKWAMIDQDRLSRIGTFRLTGRVGQLGMTAEIEITVTAYRNLAVNGGFEEADTPKGWTVTGTADAVKIDGNANNARSGTRSLNYWSDKDYAFTLFQTISGLPDGLYTLRVQASGGGGERTIRLFADGYGGARRTADIVNTGWNRWQTYAIEDIAVTGGQAVIGVEVDAPAETWGFLDDFEFFRQVTVPTWSGAARLEASDVGPTRVKLVWSGVADPAIVTGYKIYRDGVPVAAVSRDANSFTVTGLSPGTTYTFQVEAGGDAGVWTSDGPSVTVKTPPAASDGSSGPDTGTRKTPAAEPTPGSGAPAMLTIPASALAGPGDGPVVLDVPAGTGEVRLPANAADLLGARPLEVRTERLILRLPAAVLAQIAEQAGESGAAAGHLSLRLALFPKAQEWIERAEQQAGVGLTPLSPVFELRLAYVDAAGKPLAPETFAAPVTIGFRPAGSHDPERTGIFRLRGDGSLQYVGGRAANGWVEAQLSSFGACGLFEVTRTYADVPEDHWAHRAIASLSAKLVATGTPAGTFEPNRAITRAEFLAMLARWLNLPDGAAGGAFADVPDDAWYAPAVGAARAAGIVTGDSAGRFRPDRAITREEMAVLLARAFEYENRRSGSDGGEGSPLDTETGQPAQERYTDGERISAWARDAVARLTASGVVRGRPDGRFAPHEAASRAEAVQALYNLAETAESFKKQRIT